MCSGTSCSMSEKPRREATAATFSRDPVTKSSMQTTSHPWSRKNPERCEPMNPAPPVISIRIAGLRSEHGLAPDRVVLEAEAPHALGLPDVASVEDQRTPHHGPQPLEGQELELVPLRAQRDPGRGGRTPRRGMGGMG